MAVSNLSPYQLAIQSAVGKGKGAGANLTSEMAGRIADQVFGPAPVPPGSRIISQDAATVHWIDAEGFEHVATRSLDGRDPSAGQWRINTNRPNVLPGVNQQSFLNTLQGRVQQGLTETPTLAQLDPETAKALQAIYQAQQAANAQTQQDQQGQLIAQLYGRNVNQSSIANDAAARFAQYYGLVNQQTQADAANRELAVRNLLTTLRQQQTETGAGLYTALSGQDLQRALGEAGINLDYAKLAEQARQANQGFELGQQDADLRLQQSRSALDKVLKISQIAANIAGAAGGGLSAYNALIPKRNRDPWAGNPNGPTGG